MQSEHLVERWFQKPATLSILEELGTTDWLVDFEQVHLPSLHVPTGSVFYYFTDG